MKHVEIESLTVGMVLAEPVYNDHGTVELLAEGTSLSTRHIEMLKNIGIEHVQIFEEKDHEVHVDPPNEELIERVKKMVEASHDLFNVAEFEGDLKHIEEEDYQSVITSVCNRNMEINLLTGEGNVPIDIKHKERIRETKDILHAIRRNEPLDIANIKSNVEAMLPDMIRNNDVLMRLKQIEDSDDYTFHHALRVSVLASMIGKWLGYSKGDLESLATAGLLFDIGKLKIPDFILHKKGKVTLDEYDIIKKHAQLGYTILLKTKGVSQDVKFAALQHHERLDGTGYPLRLKESQLHEFSKIIMVCDTFDAMIQDRVYRSKVSPFVAAEYVAWNSGQAFDPRISYILLSNLAEFYSGKACILNTGEQGRIVYVDINYPTRPVVQVDNRFIDLSKDKRVQITDIL